MKLLKVMLYTLGAVVALLVVVGVFLPSSSHVERSIVIDAQPAQVFGYLNDFRKINEWSPWARRDPDMVSAIEGPSSGVGSTFSWSSENPEVGNGTQKIVESQPNRLVVTHLDFDSKSQAIATFRLEEAGGGTRVTWMFDMEYGWNLPFRYLGLMMGSWVGADYEEGLGNLKAIFEE